MAMRTTHPYSARPGPSLSVVGGSRGVPATVTVRASLYADLIDEIRALRAERSEVAAELEALSRRIQLAIHAERPDIALHVAGRLDALAASLTRRGAA